MSGYSISDELAESIQTGIYQKANIAYALEAVSRLLKANADGNVPPIDEVMPGIHCALEILSSVLKDITDKDIDIIDQIEGERE